MTTHTISIGIFAIQKLIENWKFVSSCFLQSSWSIATMFARSTTRCHILCMFARRQINQTLVDIVDKKFGAWFADEWSPSSWHITINVINGIGTEQCKSTSISTWTWMHTSTKFTSTYIHYTTQVKSHKKKSNSFKLFNQWFRIFSILNKQQQSKRKKMNPINSLWIIIIISINKPHNVTFEHWNHMVREEGWEQKEDWKFRVDKTVPFDI